MKILVIAAHPDDEVLGCGGTMARLTREGHEVHIAILGEGATSRHETREQANEKSLLHLTQCARDAAAILGVENVEFFGLPDNRFDTVPMLEVTKIIEGLLKKYQPSEIYTQHGGDLNIDHQITFRATLTATRPMVDQTVRAVYAYEVPSSTEWAFNKFAPAFTPNIFHDITDTLELKIQAMQKYSSESRAFPHPRSPEALRAIATRSGSVVGVTAAESFELVRLIR